MWSGAEKRGAEQSQTPPKTSQMTRTNWNYSGNSLTSDNTFVDAFALSTWGSSDPPFGHRFPCDKSQCFVMKRFCFCYGTIITSKQLYLPQDLAAQTRTDGSSFQVIVWCMLNHVKDGQQDLVRLVNFSPTSLTALWDALGTCIQTEH